MEAHGIVIEEINVHSLEAEPKDEVKNPVTQTQPKPPVIDEKPVKKAHKDEDEVQLEIIPINTETEPLFKRLFKVI